MKAWVFGDNVDTDVLAPGRYMKLPIEEIAKHCLEAIDSSFAASVQPGDIVVAGRNFGAGSSREQAPAALRHLGVAALVAESFAGLFYRNALNLGLLALVCAGAKRIRPGEIWPPVKRSPASRSPPTSCRWSATAGCWRISRSDAIRSPHKECARGAAARGFDPGS
jgi:3-isopropylmalate dehydratase small subunit